MRTSTVTVVAATLLSTATFAISHMTDDAGAARADARSATSATTSGAWASRNGTDCHSETIERPGAVAKVTECIDEYGAQVTGEIRDTARDGACASVNVSFDNGTVDSDSACGSGKSKPLSYSTVGSRSADTYVSTY